MVAQRAPVAKAISHERDKDPTTALVPQNDDAVAEPALVKQFQLQPHTIREEPFSGANDRRADEHSKLVNKTSPSRVRREPGPINGDVVAGVALEPPHDVGIELALDPRSHAARLVPDCPREPIAQSASPVEDDIPF